MAGYISVFFGILIFCIVTASLYDYGLKTDKINKRLYSIGVTKPKVVIDEDLNKSLSERFIIPIINSFLKHADKLIPQAGMSIKKTEDLRKKLRQAGMTIMPSEYSAIKIIVIIGTAVLFFVIGLVLNKGGTMILLFPLFGAYAAFTIMRFSLMSRITKRRTGMERQLPDVLDMLSVNVEAGLGFEQAILHIIEHFQGPLIDELNITYREMTMGRSRKDALTLLGERCDIDDVKSFSGAVVQAGRMGISLKNVLRTQASSIRESRRSKVEEMAQKISVKMLIPMVLFIFPVIFIVLMGPAVVSIMEMFGGM